MSAIPPFGTESYYGTHFGPSSHKPTLQGSPRSDSIPTVEARKTFASNGPTSLASFSQIRTLPTCCHHHRRLLHQL